MKTPKSLSQYSYICYECEKTQTGNPSICECQAKYCQSCFSYNDERTCCQSRNGQLRDISKQELADIRIIQKNLIYVIGLAPQISTETVNMICPQLKKLLRKNEYFGQYGEIKKMIVISSNNFNPPSHAAYVTFNNEREASLAILGCDQFQLYDRLIKASFGTTKYCSNFLKGTNCKNRDCVYLHSYPKSQDGTEILKKDEMNNSKWLFTYSQKISCQNIIKNLNEITQFKSKQKIQQSIFPSIDEIIQRMVTNGQLSQEKLNSLQKLQTSPQQQQQLPPQIQQQQQQSAKNTKSTKSVKVQLQFENHWNEEDQQFSLKKSSSSGNNSGESINGSNFLNENEEINLPEALQKRVVEIIDNMKVGQNSRFQFTKNNTNSDTMEEQMAIEVLQNKIK